MGTVYINGNIYTINKNDDKVEAIYVKDGKFVKVGSYEDMKAYMDDNNSIVDLGGKGLYPGFIDSHLHLSMLGANLYECNLSGLESIEELIDTVKDYIKEKNIPENSWVLGKGWNEDYFKIKKLPSRQDLDKISRVHKICLTRACYHMCLVNSKTLDDYGINKENYHIENGIFDIDKNGLPTGICREGAMKFIQGKLPKVGKEDFKNYVSIAQDYLLSKGITSASSDDFMLPGVKWQDVIEGYKEMSEAGELKIKVNQQCLLPRIKDIEEFVSSGYRMGMGKGNFKIGPIKILVDGNLGTRTAFLSHDYSDQSGNRGMPQYSQEELNQLIYRATKYGFQIGAHAIGDQAIHMLVDALYQLPSDLRERDIRFNIIHCQVTSPDLLEKFKKLNIIANVQPIFLNYDIHMAESRLGSQRLKWSYNFKTIIENKIRIAMGSDSPIELPDTLHGIYCAVTRKDLKGYPEGGWYPGEKISVDDAVRGFTRGSAYASFDEKLKGSIEEGKDADFIVLSDDLYNIEPDQIKDVKVEKTFVNGQELYNIDDRKS